MVSRGIRVVRPTAGAASIEQPPGAITFTAPTPAVLRDIRLEQDGIVLETDTDSKPGFVVFRATVRIRLANQ
jgi:hypothetical protein